jgi:hypothetical protein
MSLVLLTLLAVLLSNQVFAQRNSNSNYFIDELSLKGHSILYPFPVNQCVALQPAIPLVSSDSMWVFYKCASDGTSITKYKWVYNDQNPEPTVTSQCDFNSDPAPSTHDYPASDPLSADCASDYEFECGGVDNYLSITAYAGVMYPTDCAGNPELASLSVATNVCVCQPNTEFNYKSFNFECSGSDNSAGMQPYTHDSCSVIDLSLTRYSGCTSVYTYEMSGTDVPILAELTACVAGATTTTTTSPPTEDPTPAPTDVPTESPTATSTTTTTTTKYPGGGHNSASIPFSLKNRLLVIALVFLMAYKNQ